MPQNRLILDLLQAIMKSASRQGNGVDLEKMLNATNMMETEPGKFIPHQLALDSTTDPLIREMLKMMDATEQEPVQRGTRRFSNRGF